MNLTQAYRAAYAIRRRKTKQGKRSREWKQIGGKWRGLDEIFGSK
jgi:hypothetical protein